MIRKKIQFLIDTLEYLHTYYTYVFKNYYKKCFNLKLIIKDEKKHLYLFCSNIL